MKPTFALDLTRDAIALLHRNPKGWLSIGEVAFGAPDLDEALDYLRKTALGLSPMGMASKIILPNSQILYTDVTAPGPSRNDKRRQIAEALEGRTPYPVEDLVFDWSGKGATVKVAVVARETLNEAEAFATAHRLNPVSFVAIPPEGAFVGEAWFGPTTAAETLLAPGEVVDRDREPVTVLHRELPAVAEAAPAAPAAADTGIDDEEPLPGLEEALNADLPTAPADSPAPPPPPAAGSDASAIPEGLAGPLLEETPRRTDGPAVAAEDAAETVLSRALSETPSGLASDPSIPTSGLDAAERPAALSGETPAAEIEEAPFAHVTDVSAFPDGDDEIPPRPPEARTSRPADGPAADDDIPPAPSAAAIAAFASRRAAGTQAAGSPAAGPVPGVVRSSGVITPTGGPGGRLGQPIPRPAPVPGPPKGLVTAPSIPGTRARPKGKVGGSDAAAASLAAPSTVRSPARPGGTFGSSAPPRNRTGVVFLILVALLLLFLAVMAAWSSFWLSQNGSSQQDADQSSLSAAPGVDDEMLADMQDPEGMTDPLPEAQGMGNQDAGALATEDAPINLALEDDVPAAGGDPAPVDVVEDTAAAPVEVAPAPAEVEAPAADQQADAVAAAPDAGVELAAEPAQEAASEPAPGTTVATEISPVQAPVEDQDEIFLAAMDAPPPALDALALPEPAAVVDAAPDAPVPPPAFGTVYQFDANGLLKPTPEGILSPEGVLLIAGPPPVLPPPRSAAAEAAALAAAPAATPAAPAVVASDDAASAQPAADASLVTAPETPTAEPVPSDPAMAGFRPLPRPEGLVPANDDGAALTTVSSTSVAGLRPLSRPASVLATASAARPTGEAADLGAQGASLAAQAEADLAAAAALEAENPSVVAISRRPEARPRDLSRAVEAAVAAAVREAEPQPEAEVVAAAAAAPAPELKPEELAEADEPETASAAPKIPTRANVAKQATFKNAINLGKVNLIGTYGTDSKRYALIRQSNGRYKKVKVGDKVDFFTVTATTETEVRYQKGGKLLTLKMPKA